jgi:hypothetical protein
MKIIILIILVAIILYFIYNILNKDKSNFTNKKILRYYGAHYCPYSNENSNAYKVIKDFEDKYGNEVQITYYWSEENQDEMQKNNIMYVPTIMNGSDIQIEIRLPDDINKEGKTLEELKNILLTDLYNKL